MTVSSIFAEAAAALKFNRQRSILTTISLAWGVACFVILYSYGDGFHFACCNSSTSREVLRATTINWQPALTTSAVGWTPYPG